MPTRHLLRLRALVIPVMLLLSSCGSGQNDVSGASGRRVVELPGAAGNVDFDDMVYSPRLERVLVPARERGLYLVEPDSSTATRVHPGTADSADEGAAGRIEV